MGEREELLMSQCGNAAETWVLIHFTRPVTATSSAEHRDRIYLSTGGGTFSTNELPNARR